MPLTTHIITTVRKRSGGKKNRRWEEPVVSTVAVRPTPNYQGKEAGVRIRRSVHDYFFTVEDAYELANAITDAAEQAENHTPTINEQETA